MTPDHAASVLREGLQALNTPLSEVSVNKLLAYQALLLKWNRVYNLTAIEDDKGVLVHHLLDSASVLPWVGESRLLDVGSGAGLPGIPLAIARPTLQVTLVDAVQKKVSFQRQTCIELGLNNVEPLHGRVESLSGKGRYDRIVSRAFADLNAFVSLTRPLLAQGGYWLAMKGRCPDQELVSLPPGVCVEAIHPLVVPGLKAERHLIVLKAV